MKKTLRTSRAETLEAGVCRRAFRACLVTASLFVLGACAAKTASRAPDECVEAAKVGDTAASEPGLGVCCGGSKPCTVNHYPGPGAWQDACSTQGQAAIQYCAERCAFDHGTMACQCPGGSTSVVVK